MSTQAIAPAGSRFKFSAPAQISFLAIYSTFSASLGAGFYVYPEATISCLNSIFQIGKDPLIGNLRCEPVWFALAVIIQDWKPNSLKMDKFGKKEFKKNNDTNSVMGHYKEILLVLALVLDPVQISIDVGYFVLSVLSERLEFLGVRACRLLRRQTDARFSCSRLYSPAFCRPFHSVGKLACQHSLNSSANNTHFESHEIKQFSTTFFNRINRLLICQVARHTFIMLREMKNISPKTQRLHRILTRSLVVQACCWLKRAFERCLK